MNVHQSTGSMDSSMNANDDITFDCGGRLLIVLIAYRCLR